tara:strand:- start:4689 stop:5459 length:771 start_codon:yes stop_codon:yes gene_type:complete
LCGNKKVEKLIKLAKRVMSLTENKHRCLTCRRPQMACLCEFVSPVETNTKFVILMHPKEYKKVKIATGRLTHLQLKNSEILVDINFSQNKRLNKLIESHNSFVLYPNEKSLNLTGIQEKKPIEFKQETLFIVIDATWYLAKKMYKESTNLHALRSISFEHNRVSEFKIKQQPFPKCLSTIESVKIVIEELNRLNIETCPLENFLNPFYKMVEYQIECQMNPPMNSYRNDSSLKKLDKTQYRSKQARNLFFQLDAKA